MSLVCIFFASLSGFAEEFVIRYQPLTSGGIFHVETAKGASLGTVVRGKKGEFTLYSLLDTEQHLLAHAREEKKETNTIVSIVDPRGIEIGSFCALHCTFYPTEYNVFASGQKWVAKGVMNWLGNNFALIDPYQSEVNLVTFLRPRFKLFKDYWHFQIHDESAIDFRILCIIGTFQTVFDLIFDEI